MSTPFARNLRPDRQNVRDVTLTVCSRLLSFTLSITRRLARSEAKEEIMGLLREQEAADLLGLSVRTLQKWRLERRAVPFVKLPGSGAIRYRRDDLESWIAAGRVATAA